MRTTRRIPSNGQAGFSLVEGLIAAALLLVVAVSVLPIFIRALDSNLAGGRRSQLSTFASGELEELNQESVDQAAWSVAGAPGGVLELGSRFWDIGADVDNAPEKLGDEKWVDLEGDAAGLILFQRSSASVRKYNLADIQVVVGAGGGLASSGANPMLFDNPLADDDGAHLTEIRISIRENRETLNAASGKRITVRQFRVY